MAQPLEPNTAHEHDALLGDQDQRESNGEESTEFRDTTHPKSKRALFLDNSVVRVLKITLGCSYSNLLLPFVFLGILGGSLGWDDSISFFFNFLAILPLAALLSFATEELAKSVGQTVGGLINATFGNAVEMIVSGWTFDSLARWETDTGHRAGGYYCGPTRRNQHRAV
jgi:Ca2+:H+ antiporter